MNRLALLLVLCGAVTGRTADTIVVMLPAKASSGSATITLGQVARIHGGDETARQKLATIDLADRSKNDTAVTITRRQVELRLRLAGYTEEAVLVGGAGSFVVSFAKKSVPVEDAIAAAKKSLLDRFPNSAELKLEVAIPPTARMPEVGEKDPVEFVVVPHASDVKIGRNQMDVTIKVNGETKLVFPVHLEVKSGKSDVVLVTPRRPVKLVVQSGALRVEAPGEVLQDGREGETVQVRNSSSKKQLFGRVIAADRVQIEMGGMP